MPPCRVRQCLGPVNNLILEGYSETVVSGVQVTTFFGDKNLKSILDMKPIFCFKMRKI